MNSNEKLENFTSTGNKFWSHPNSLASYYNDSGHSVISTHISPHGGCNLDCSYCSVSKRDQNKRIELPVIKDYVNKLTERGLKAVILTGGGEPTLYKHFNELVRWLKYTKQLSVALITNGTTEKKVDDLTWKCFSWVRVSINPDQSKEIHVPKDKLSEDCVLGCSYIYHNKKYLVKAHQIAKNMGAEYMRVLPDCNLGDPSLMAAHSKLNSHIETLDLDLAFVQKKFGRTPHADLCHQAYFRPYLSEVDGGTVYPCDSLVLNKAVKHFHRKYALCKADEILDFLDKKIPMKFSPQTYCNGCVFANNVEMLERFKTDAEFRIIKRDILHKEFV
jgi:MoaA/NifB/PqqE/SkfB family radical SAM enzyme